MKGNIIIVPCYNEATRFDFFAFNQYLAQAHDLFFLFIDDGSFDDTFKLLKRLQTAYPNQVEIIKFDENRGKAEAIRRGFLWAFEQNPLMIGYLDADLAVSLEEAERLTGVLLDSPAKACFGSRVALLGRNIQRKASRHYLGRVFATFASLILNLGIYDTQCGAKIFKNQKNLPLVFQKPFMSRWAFDVELIQRMMQWGGYNKKDIIEEPLMAWVDKPGSKVSVFSMFRMGLDLFKIWARY